MAKGPDKRGAGAEGVEERPRLSREARAKAGAERQEKALVEYLGTSYINSALKEVAAQVDADIEAGSFDTSADSIYLNVTVMSDKPLRMEAFDRHDAAVKARAVSRDSKPVALSAKEAQEFAGAGLAAYEAAVKVRDEGRKTVKMKGLGSNESKARQFDREQAVLDMEASEYEIEDGMDVIYQTPAAITLNKVLNKAGYELTPVRVGPVWKFRADKIQEAPVVEKTEDLFPGLTGKARDEAILAHGRKVEREEAEALAAEAEQEARLQDLEDRVEASERRASEAEAREKAAHADFMRLLTEVALRGGIDIKSFTNKAGERPNGAATETE